jgi:hypothetical protein
MQPIAELSACSMQGGQNFPQVDACSSCGRVELRLVIRKPMAFLNQFAHRFLKSTDLVVELWVRAGIHGRISSYQGWA